MQILVTGGAGYIGSHVCVELLNAGYEVVVADNLCNSVRNVIPRIEEMTGRGLTFYEADVREVTDLNRIFEAEKIECVIHLAGLKSVEESTANPISYYENNVGGTITLCKAMQAHQVKNMIVSSSATVYGEPELVPIPESHPHGTVNSPYARSKDVIEQLVMDIQQSDKAWNVIVLRYFNPIGAYPGGRIGEASKGSPKNLLPHMAQVAMGKQKVLEIFGNDYETPDGTGVRDYIHVVDVAAGHVRAIDKIKEAPGFKTYNLGTGKGYSVMDVLHAFENACGHAIPYVIRPRRKGDIALYYADSTLARTELGWETRYNLDDMCRDFWEWKKHNPNGYESGNC